MTTTQKDLQRKTEWLHVTDGAKEYHKSQLQSENIYRSTVKFCDWLEECGVLDSEKELSVADIGAGAGGALFYMAKRFPRMEFTGIELNPEYVEIGNNHFKEIRQNNCSLEQGDLYGLDLSHTGKYNGIVSLATLSWLPDFRVPIEKMAALKPDWMAVTSLFYDGPVNVKIETQDYKYPIAGKPYMEGFYNTYAIPLVQEHLKELGYNQFDYVPFEIDIDIPKVEKDGMATYTEKLENGKRIQISASVLMNWYFILARK